MDKSNDFFLVWTILYLLVIVFLFPDFCFTSMVTPYKHMHCLDPKHHRVALCHFHKQNPVAGIDCCSAYSYGPAGLCKCLLTQGAFFNMSSKT